MKSWFSRTISLALIFAMLFQLMPMSVLAADNQLDAEQMVEDTLVTTPDDLSDAEPVREEFTAEDVMWEDTSLREENIKHYRMSDGSYIAVDYGYAVHYKDENGDYQEIDNRLFVPAVEDGGELEVAAADVADTDRIETDNRPGWVSFANTAVDNAALITIGSGDNAVSMTPYAKLSSGSIVEEEMEEIEAPTESAEAAESEEEAVAAEEEAAAPEEETAVPEIIEPEDGAIELPVVEEELITMAAPSNNISIIETVEQMEMNEVQASVQNTAAEPDEELSLLDAITPEYGRSEVVYSNIFPNVDLEYVLIGNDVKENIIINSATSNYVFPFLLELGGDMTLEAQEDGSVYIVDGEDVAYVIEAPYMYDAAGETSAAVSYEFEMVKPGIYLFVTTADEEWINAEGREFPVTVDPSVYYSPTHLDYTSTYIYSQYPAQSYSSITSLRIGSDTSGGDYIYRSLWKLDTLPTLPENSTVVGAELHFTYTYIPVNLYTLGVVACELGSDASAFWGGSMTWNNCPAIGSMLDHANVTSSATTFYLDITRAYVKWFNDSSTNYGVIIKALDETVLTSSSGARIDATKSSSPILLLNYRNTVGLESYYTYQSHSVGRAGTGYIGDYTGGLTLVKQDASAASTVMPVSVSHVYNSAYSDKEFSSVANTYTAMKLGVGWQLSAMESVYEGVSCPVYVDSDGTEHYFIWSESDSCYLDEDGLGLRLTLGTDNDVITDRYGGTKCFIDGRLSWVTDANGNQVIYNYNTSAQLTSITRLVKGGSTETIASFTYDSSGYLSTIKDYSNNTTTFTYTTISGVKYLSGVSHPDGTTVTYSYSEGKLITAKDNESGYSMNYSYSDLGRIASFTEMSGTTSGAKIIAKGTSDGLQTYCYVGADRVVSKSDYFNAGASADCGCTSTCTCDDDNILTYMSFDYHGRTVNTYSTNAEGTILYGVDSAKYQTNSGTASTNNRVLVSSTVGTQPENFVPNGGFESGISDWSRSTTTYITLSSNEVHTGASSVTITGSTSYARNIYRTISGLEAGTYVLSAYVNTSGVTSFASNGGVYVGTSSSAVGQKLNYVTDGWERVSYTATVGTGGTLTFRVYGSYFTGTIYIDDLQLERCIIGTEGAPSSVNLLNDGSMVQQSVWNCTNATYSDGTLKMSASPSTASYATQSVTLNMPGTQTYIYSAWAKAESGPLDRTDNFALKAIIKYSDNTTETHLDSFSREYTGWQYLAMPIVPKQPSKTVSSITVYLNYNYNLNTAYFDKVALVREEAASYTYNENGDLTGVTATDSEQQSYSYSGADLISQTTMGSGDYSYGYDTKHNVTSVGHDTTSMSLTYSTAGNVTNSVLTSSAHSGVSITSSAAYTNNNNLVASVTDARGETTSYTYNTGIYRQLGLATSVTDANGTKVVTTRNASNARPTQSYISGLASLGYTYSGGSLTAISRGSYIAGDTSTKYTQTYNLEYDSFDKLTSVKVSTRPLASYTYADGNGLLSKLTYGNSDYVNYTYDELERLSGTSYNDRGSVEYYYNGMGLLGKVVDNETSRIYIYNYDTLGRLIGMGEYNSTTPVQTFSAGYDTQNRISTINYRVDPTWSNALGSSRTYTYTYSDTDGTLTSMTGPSSRIAYTYDGFNRLTQKNVYNSTSGGTAIVKRALTYLEGATSNNTTSLVKSVTNTTSSGTVINKFVYTYDALGNILSISDGTNVISSYTYDAQGQMLTETIDGVTNTYTYDSAGNIRSKTDGTTTVDYTYGSTLWLDMLTAYDGGTISYDASGNPTKWHDGSTFTWETGKRLMSATLADGTALSYTYDADGLRLTKVVDGVTHYYVWQGDRLISESYGTSSLEFFYDESGLPYAFYYYDSATTTNNGYYYYITNLQGDIVGIRNSSGTSKAVYQYNAWGEEITATGTMASINPLRYRGYYYDAESGFYYLQSRYYSPEVGRFINADEFASTGQGFIGYNMFTYCGNNPINRSDPNGQLWAGLQDLVKKIFHVGNNIATDMGVDTAAIGASFLDMYENEPGVYHAKTDCWQQYFGYNNAYDFFFNLGTSMQASKFTFTHENTEYVIWTWKGDYINLGAGAELGIYCDGGPHWSAATGNAMPMTVSLDYKGQNIISHTQTTWWITGFNSNYLNVSASELNATYSICFSSNPGMYNSFYGMHYSTPGWTFDSQNYVARFSF